MDPATLPLPAAGREPSAPPNLRIAQSAGRGRGVFAEQAFGAGEVIERAPVIVFARTDVRPLAGTLLDDYWFWWDEQHNAAALGCGSLYNHACPANARYAPDAAGRTMVFVAVRDIAAGEELTVDYRSFGASVDWEALHSFPIEGYPTFKHLLQALKKVLRA